MKRKFKCWNCGSIEEVTGVKIGNNHKLEMYIFGSKVDFCDNCGKSRRYEQFGADEKCLDEVTE